MAEDQRPPGADPVDVLVAVDVPDAVAFAPGEEDRIAPDRPHCPDRGVDPAGHHVHGLPVELRGPLGVQGPALSSVLCPLSSSEPKASGACSRSQAS